MKFLILFLILSIPIPALAAPANYGDFHGAEYVRNYDGNTVTFNLPNFHPIIGSKISIRVNGIDTPEIRGKCKAEKELAYIAKEMVEILLTKAKNIDLLNMQRGKYFRIVADVAADGQNVKEVLIDNSLAVPYDGGTKYRDWCLTSPLQPHVQ